MWKYFNRLLRLPIADKLLLLEALLALASARLAMFLLPFRSIAAWMGTRGAQSPAAASPEDLRIAQKVGWAVAALARRVPWDSRCLAQALAGSAMLRRRGLEGTVNFGARRDQSTPLAAHAWLRFGPAIITGASGHESFQIFTSFARRRNP